MAEPQALRLVRYIFIRTVIATLTLLGVSVLVFVAMRFIPGGFEDLILGPFATEQAREIVRQRFGLDQPVPIQYWRWLVAGLSGDLGTSMITHQSVAAEIFRRAGTTIQLAVMATTIAVVVGVPLGVSAAVRGNKGLLAGFSRGLVALGLGVPDFVMGSLLVYVFSQWSLGLSVGGFVPFAVDPLANLRVTILPAATLGFFGIALMARTSAFATREVLVQPHITNAVARGAKPGDIIRLHVLRNAAIPVVTSATVFFGYLLGGTVVVEQLYSVPGLGNYIITALGNRDYVVVQAGVLLGAFFFLVINLVTDFLYALLDPRVGEVR